MQPSTWIKLILVLVCIVIVLCILYLLVAIIIFLPTSLVSTCHKDLNLDDFKTGDIVAARGQVIFIKLFDRGDISHPGVIWVDPESNQKYVLEGSKYKGGKYKNFFKIPLELWLYIRKGGDLYHIPLNKAACPNKIMKAFQPFIDHAKLDRFNLNWTRFLKKRSYDKPKIKNHYACIEAVISTLQHADVYKKIYYCGSYLPCEVIYGGIECESGYSYSKPIGLDLTRWLLHMEVMDGRFSR